VAKKKRAKPDKFDDGLTVRQRRFVELYDGNATEAAAKAGYTGTRRTLAVTGYWLMRNPKIRERVDAKQEGLLRRFHLNREERQELRSEMAVDPDLEPSLRLKALEQLGKAEADFTERLEVKGELTLEMLVLASRKP
jgi:phage terminase small subunit